jgi:hypothetical protein
MSDDEDTFELMRGQEGARDGRQSQQWRPRIFASSGAQPCLIPFASLSNAALNAARVRTCCAA